VNSDNFDEYDLIGWIKERTPRRTDTFLGIGDDAAWIASPPKGLIVCTDTIVEGVHFLPETPKELVGRKALAVNLSDIAAMGATPTSALFNPIFPRSFTRGNCLAVCEGVMELASKHGLEIIGGDTVFGTAPLAINITVFGTLAGEPITRFGAKPGDILCVTGSLGGSFASGRHLTFEPRLEESRWLKENCPPTAMMDVSDGLGSDLRTLAKASGVGFVLNRNAIPVTPAVQNGSADPLQAAFSDGEDFELLFTLPPTKVKSLAHWPFPTLCTVIGEATATGKLLWQGDPAQEIPYMGDVHKK
jgi:thiamine-monophosphate kinase